jgi:hypothetical protein
MANAFSKEERVAFEDLLAGFQDALVLSKNVNIYRTDGTMMERARDTIWRPMPYIAQSINSVPGTAISGYQDMTQLAVPATLGFSKTVPWTMTTLQLRDALQEGRLGDSAKQKLASDINVAMLNVASQQGTLVVPIGAPSGTFDDVALCDAIMNEQGVPMEDRCLALSSRDYNGLAGNLAGGTIATLYNGRSFNGDKSNRAFERAFVGTVANFDTFKMDYALRCAANAVTPTIATNGAQVRYVPQATSTSVGGQINVDNRYQVVTISAVTGIVPGDMFEIAGIEAVHHITKESTGQLKTFRVIDTPTSDPSLGAAEIRISPPMIGANSTPTDAELQYKNIEVVSTSGTAAINFLNTTATAINPFWHKSAMELLPGRYAVPSDAGAAIMRASTDQGIELVMQKFYDIDSMTIKYRLDTLFGVVMTNPEMCGVLVFNQ